MRRIARRAVEAQEGVAREQHVTGRAAAVLGVREDGARVARGSPASPRAGRARRRAEMTQLLTTSRAARHDRAARRARRARPSARTASRTTSSSAAAGLTVGALRRASPGPPASSGPRARSARTAARPRRAPSRGNAVGGFEVRRGERERPRAASARPTSDPPTRRGRPSRRRRTGRAACSRSHRRTNASAQRPEIAGEPARGRP